jgi:lipopolysaccharide/colanic/teichoic acid biosynthesis glycosyltransferase
VRRAADVVVASALLVASAPVFAIVAALNWLATRRVFFRQTRIGMGLRPFEIVKFQTMVDGAARGGSITARGDRRVTRIGRLLRAAKLDELPQLVNVVRGEMGLVGPRPLTPNEIAAIPVEQARRIYAIRPGMTGIASLVFIDEERLLGQTADPEAAYFGTVLPRKVALEIAYAARRTWVTDLLILVVTPLAGLFPRLRQAAVARLVPGAALGMSDPVA